MNAVVLAGAVVEPPYFDFLRQTPFLRFYLAVPRREVKGHDHIRVVAYGKLAQGAYARLTPGVSVALTGHLQTRALRKLDSLVMEVVAERVRFPDDGIVTPINSVALAGTVSSPPWFGFVGKKPVLRLFVAVPRMSEGGEGDSHIRVVAYEKLARESYAYLHPGAEIALLGNLQVRPVRPGRPGPQSVMEVVASHFSFIANVDWATGDAVLAQLRQLEEQTGAAG